MEYIKQIHKGDLISDYLEERFQQNVVGITSDEDYEDYEVIHIGYGRADNDPIEISHLQEMIDELQKRGSTHIAIDYNCDHGEYELSGFTYEKLNSEELAAIENKKLTDLEKIEKIRILERQIQEIKNT